jgi:hypothetical protein
MSALDRVRSWPGGSSSASQLPLDNISGWMSRGGAILRKRWFFAFGRHLFKSQISEKKWSQELISQIKFPATRRGGKVSGASSRQERIVSDG